MRSFEEIKLLLREGSADEKEKARKADQLLGEFYKVPFALNLSFLCDIYRVYSTAANILQVRIRSSNVINSKFYISGSECTTPCSVPAILSSFGGVHLDDADHFHSRLRLLLVC